MYIFFVWVLVLGNRATTAAAGSGSAAVAMVSDRNTLINIFVKGFDVPHRVRWLLGNRHRQHLVEVTVV